MRPNLDDWEKLNILNYDVYVKKVDRRYFGAWSWYIPSNSEEGEDLHGAASSKDEAIFYAGYWLYYETETDEKRKVYESASSPSRQQE